SAGSGVSSTCGYMPTGVQLTRMSQLSGSGGQGPTFTEASLATSSALARLRACNVTEHSPEPSATMTARAAPPAPSTATRSPFSATRCCNGSRKPLASVFPPIQRLPSTRIVLMAPIRLATAYTSSIASNSATLNGIVTLAPLMPLARAKSRKPSAATATGSASATPGHGHGSRVAPRRVERGVVHPRRQRVAHRSAGDPVDIGRVAERTEMKVMQERLGADLPDVLHRACIRPRRSESAGKHARRGAVRTHPDQYRATVTIPLRTDPEQRHAIAQA